MDNTSINITEAELEVMKVLWEADEPLTIQQVTDVLKNKEWKYSTIATLFGRMVDKGTVTYEKRSRHFAYSPVLTEKKYKTHQTKNFISKLYNGSVKNLVVSLFEDEHMSPDDINELKKLIDSEG